ncbi:MAG: hypothetical protein FJ276_31125, partial [Planctomycetes bacterium]|nr:hypothetical protein [Planctomycetota bacterium]
PGQPNPAWDTLDQDRQRDLARRMAVYAAMVESVDQGVGRIMEHLRATGELANTLLLFLSDNGACYEWGPFGFDGPSRRGTTTLRTGDDVRQIGGRGTYQSYGSGWANLGNTPLQLYKHFTHEGGICTPLIVHWPQGIGSPDTWVRDPVHVMDIFPTLLEVTGATYPNEIRGNSILPLEGTSLVTALRGGRLPERTVGFDHQGARALREGDWKIVWSKRMPHDIAWELYNLAEDRCETQDLAAKHPDRVQAMAARWEQWARRVQVIYEPPTGSDTPQAAKITLPPESLETPEIANRSLTITGRVRTSSSDGVIVAQGGREQGYAVHLLDGHLAFDVRVNGEVTRIAASRAAPNEFGFDARLTADQLLLLLNGQQVAAAASPGLIPLQPKDGLNIGRDELSAAGDYQAPNPLEGTITDVKVTTGPAGKEATQFPPSAFIQQKTDRKPRPVMDAETIRAGLESHDRALYVKAGWIRDPYITLGPDDFYYLTGTQPREGDPREAADPYNIGLGDESIVGDQVRLWRSRDLFDWESLGPIFTVDDTRTARSGANIPRRLIWAPEVHWLPKFGDNGRWALVHCPKSHSSLALSTARDLKGPWTHPLGDRFGERHDPSLFQDDDGTCHLLWGNTLIAPLSSDFSRYTAEPVRIDPAGSRTNALGEAKSAIGHEGATMIKVGGKYVHLGTAWSTDQVRKGSYNLYYCVADKITGPYGPRKFAGRFLGHGTPFQSRDGKWWCTAFFNANVPPLPREGIETRDLSENALTINEQGVTIVPLHVRVLDDGTIFIRAKDPAYASPGPDEVQTFDLEERDLTSSDVTFEAQRQGKPKTNPSSGYES